MKETKKGNLLNEVCLKVWGRGVNNQIEPNIRIVKPGYLKVF